MPKVSSEKLYSTFVKGLITESNPLTYPENSSLDEDNFVLSRTGARSRRLGIDYEANYALKDTGFTTTQIAESKQSFHSWESPAGDTSISIGVIRVAGKLWFIDVLSVTPSATYLNAGNFISLSGLNNANIDVAVINNSLLVVSSELVTPILLTYDKATGLVSQEPITLKIRDLIGVEDGIIIDVRPATISNTHRYNLKNQGWSDKITSVCGTNAIDCTFTKIATYPSSADIWTLGKIGSSTSADYEKYDPNAMVKNSIDNAPASKGGYIIDAFLRGADRTAKSTLTDLPIDQETGKITTIAAYASRIFYSGVASAVTGGDKKSPNYSGYILFSQVVTSNDNLGKCYQEADPTSPNISDIIDTDGGTIQVPEITRVVKLLTTSNSLIIFAENGVWEVFGDTGGFTATSFQLSKISSVGITNKSAVVEANGAVFYFAKAGIYAISPDQTSGRLRAESISLTTIQTLYTNLPDLAKSYAKGLYDEKQNTIRWLYNDTSTYSLSTNINKYNRELILDLTLRAFYVNSISSLLQNSPYVADYVVIPGYSVSTTKEDVYVGADAVLSNTDTTYINISTQSNRSALFSFLTIRGSSITLSKYNSRTFYDWFTADNVGMSYSSYLITGYETFGEIMRSKQVPYIFLYFEKTETGFTTTNNLTVLANPSGCLLQSQWNWTNDVNSGKWGTQFQAYKFKRNYIPYSASDPFTYGEQVIVTKNKLRGSGKALSLKIESEAGKDMKLLGWAVTITGVGTV